MERRRSTRIDLRLRARSILKDNVYKGSIENFSREGMMEVILNRQVLGMLPGTTIGVSFQTPSGETLNLECEVKWIRHLSNLPFAVTHHIGMEIKNPPQKYMEFVESLYSIHLSAPLVRNQN
jgi:hypothetical protein